MLSESVAKALELTGGEEVTKTVKFIKMMDHFDCLNVNNFHMGKQKRKQFQDPYRSGDDFRLKVIFIFVCPTSIMLHAVTTFATNPMQWLEDEFLGYLQNWEGSVMAQSGLSMKEENSMLLSLETLSMKEENSMLLSPETLSMKEKNSMLLSPETLSMKEENSMLLSPETLSMKEKTSMLLSPETLSMKEKNSMLLSPETLPMKENSMLLSPETRFGIEVTGKYNFACTLYINLLSCFFHFQYGHSLKSQS